MAMKQIIFALIIFGLFGGVIYYAFIGLSPEQTEVINDDVSIQDTMNELQIEDIQEGTGAEAVNGALISVHYTGTLEDGTVFDSSRTSGVPFEFALGQGQVIAGWDQGVLGMKVGGKRKLTIPSSLAYGDNGIPGTIPPKATLIFEVELMDVQL